MNSGTYFKTTDVVDYVLTTNNIPTTFAIWEILTTCLKRFSAIKYFVQLFFDILAKSAGDNKLHKNS